MHRNVLDTFYIELLNLHLFGHFRYLFKSQQEKDKFIVLQKCIICFYVERKSLFYLDRILCLSKQIFVPI